MPSNRPDAHLTGSAKPAKPYPEFPLFPHATRRWAKKIRGRLHYFGPWSDPDGALARYLDQRDALHAGRKPREVSAGVTVKDVCNAWLNFKRLRLEAGELSPRTWRTYREVAGLVVARFGPKRAASDLAPDDFAELRTHMTAARGWGPVRTRVMVQHVRGIFKYAAESRLIPSALAFGPGFARPSNKTIRLERARKGPRMFEPDEVRALAGGALVVGRDGPRLVRASAAVRAMVLLGVNCGFGNADCGTLPLAALDLDGGWANHHRPKTGVARRCHLWPETVAALRAWLAVRPDPADPAHAGLAFLTARGAPWHKATSDCPLAKETRKLLDALGVGGNRSFYALRHTFETVGGEARDQVAVDHVMGHARDDMASAYRERISDGRLKAVSEHVRRWVHGGPAGATAAQPAA